MDESAETNQGELMNNPEIPAFREHLVEIAVKFLKNSRVQNSPLDAKKSFLKKKGHLFTWTRRIGLAIANAGVLFGVYQLYKICQTWFGRVEGTMDNINSTVSHLQSAVDDFARTMATQAQIQRLPSQQEQSLCELKTEVHSLKSLLLSRKHFPPPSSSLLPSWQMAKSAIACEPVTDAAHCSITDPQAEELPIIETQSNQNDLNESADMS
uniref:peroxisomal membrane protein PEX14-like isoform X2 n=1 Tax=Myxine glutinosa TaxID=7769 RepID=UPI00358F6B3F